MTCMVRVMVHVSTQSVSMAFQGALAHSWRIAFHGQSHRLGDGLHSADVCDRNHIGSSGAMETGGAMALWMEAHRDVCDRNHTGSSGAAETDGAKLLCMQAHVDVGLYSAPLGEDNAAVMGSYNAIGPYPGVTEGNKKQPIM